MQIMAVIEAEPQPRTARSDARPRPGAPVGTPRASENVVTNVLLCDVGATYASLIRVSKQDSSSSDVIKPRAYGSPEISQTEHERIRGVRPGVLTP